MTNKADRFYSATIQPAKLIAAATLSAVILAPLLASWGRPESGSLYLAFSGLCHQLPERSWHLAGQPLAVCVRCLGFYLGAGAAIWLSFGFDSRSAVLSGVVLFLTWTLEASGLVVFPSAVRFLAAGAFGAAAASVFTAWDLRFAPLASVDGPVGHRYDQD